MSARKGKCHLEWRKKGKPTVRCNHLSPIDATKNYDEVTCGNCIYLVERDRVINDEKLTGYAESGYFPISDHTYQMLMSAGTFVKYGLPQKDPIVKEPSLTLTLPPTVEEVFPQIH